MTAVTRLRAHLARVDRGYVVLHTAGAIVAASCAALFADDDRTGFTDSKNWLWTAIVAATAAIAFTALAHAAAEVIWPNSEEQIRELEALNEECQRQADAIEAMDEEVVRLTNELDDVRADRDSLLTERDEILAETGHAVTKLAELSADLWDDPAPDPDSRYVSDAVTSFNRSARDAFLAKGPPPGYGQDTGEAK